MAEVPFAAVDGQDFRVTVNIGDARPGDIVHIAQERLDDPWMQGQIAASILVPVPGNARVTGGEGEPSLDTPVSPQEPPQDTGTADTEETPAG